MSSCYFVFNHSVLLCPIVYSANLHNSLTVPSCTALVQIRFSTASRLLISLHCSTKSSNHKPNPRRPTSSSTTNFPWPPHTANCSLCQLPASEFASLITSCHVSNSQKTRFGYCCVTPPHMRCMATVHARTRRSHFLCCYVTPTEVPRDHYLGISLARCSLSSYEI
jgi:hypothetical protein